MELTASPNKIEITIIKLKDLAPNFEDVDNKGRLMVEMRKACCMWKAMHQS